MNNGSKFEESPNGSGEKLLTEEQFESRLEKKMDERFVPLDKAVPGIDMNGLELMEGDSYKYYLNEGADSGSVQSTNPLAHAKVVYFPERWETKINKNASEYKVKMLEFIEGAFEGRAVVDLGAGDSAIDYYITDRAKAASYIGVDVTLNPNIFMEINISDDEEMVKYFTKEKAGKFSDFEPPSHAVNHTPAALVRSDMLSLLKKLPDNSVSIFCSGIDQAIISDERYLDETKREIERVLSPAGGYIGSTSHISLPESGGIEHEILKGEAGITTLHRYRKRSSK